MMLLFLNMFDNLRASLSRVGMSSRYEDAAPDPSTDETSAPAMMETLYSEMVAVMNTLPQLRQEDFDLESVKTLLLLPIAHYLVQPTNSETNTHFLKPLFVTGIPGIGKTTLLMILDEVLSHLGRSCRDMFVSGEVRGYFADKPPMHITPLPLFGQPTAVLSARDWNNILRHWAYDE